MATRGATAAVVPAVSPLKDSSGVTFERCPNFCGELW